MKQLFNTGRAYREGMVSGGACALVLSPYLHTANDNNPPSNPYRFGSPRWFAWEDGWHVAKLRRCGVMAEKPRIDGFLQMVLMVLAFWGIGMVALVVCIAIACPWVFL